MRVVLQRPGEFAQAFVDAYLSQGFQSLSKRDMDLLIFLLLEHDGALSRDGSNFDLARVLRITRGKVRTLRRDAYARWRPLLSESEPKVQLQRILQGLLTEERIEAGAAYAISHNKAEGYLAVRLEHTDDRELLEQALLEAGEYPVHERNPEVMVVSLGSMLAVAKRYGFVADADKFYLDLKRMAAKSKDLQDILTADLKEVTWDEVRVVVNRVGARIVAKELEGVRFRSLLKLMFPFLP